MEKKLTLGWHLLEADRCQETLRRQTHHLTGGVFDLRSKSHTFAMSKATPPSTPSVQTEVRMSGFNVKSTVVGLVLLVVGLVIGYQLGLSKKPVVMPDAAIVSQPASSTPAVYASGPGGCFHVDGSEYICPGMRDLEVAGDRLFLRGDSITIGSISVRYRGATYVLPIPGKVDAIFFTPEAAQILVEHYKATNPAKATALQHHLDGLPHP